MVETTLDPEPIQDLRPEPPPTRWPRWLRRALIAVAVMIGVFYLGGGWYFSSQLGDDAFVVDHDDVTEFDVEIAAITDEQITLQVAPGDEPTLDSDGVYGLAHELGRLQLGRVVASDTTEDTHVVVREYSVLSGAAPDAGTFGDLDSWLYPADPTFVDRSYEEIYYQSELGPMAAWYVPGGDTTWAVIVHGKGATRRETVRMIGALPDSMPVLSITYRNDDGAPADPSGYYRYGVTEWRDVEAAVRYAVEHGAQDVALVGLSTGAPISLAFVYESELADTVSSLILDAPNLDFGRTVDYGASRRTLPVIGTQVPQSMTTVAKFIGSIRFGVDWSELDYTDRASELDVPVLLFHGSDDTTVPVDESERLATERPDLVELRIVEGAEHVQSWNVDATAYADAVVQFLAIQR